MDLFCVGVFQNVIECVIHVCVYVNTAGALVCLCNVGFGASWDRFLFVCC